MSLNILVVVCVVLVIYVLALSVGNLYVPEKYLPDFSGRGKRLGRVGGGTPELPSRFFATPPDPPNGVRVELH
jgi:hypothetical protein